MNDVTWGAAIAVNGVRPEWLGDGDECQWRGDKTEDGHWNQSMPSVWSRNNGGYQNVTHIRLPADHPHYHPTQTADEALTRYEAMYERMKTLVDRMALGVESITEQYSPVNTGLGRDYTEAKAISDALKPVDPDVVEAQRIANASPYQLHGDNVGETNGHIRDAILAGIKFGRSAS